MPTEPKTTKSSVLAIVYLVLMVLSLILMAFFIYIAFSMVAEYGDDGVGSAWLFAGVSALGLVATVWLGRLYFKARR